jgi:hypothetical protein
MARRTESSFHATAMLASALREADPVTFTLEGQERRVDLRAPRPIRRDGRWMAHLMDLWVASSLPGEFLDLHFELVTSGPGDTIHRSRPLEPLHFARGMVDVTRRDLWWDDPADRVLIGLRMESVVVVREAPPARDAAPESGVRRVAPVSIDHLHRLLPRVVRAYPTVEWRKITDDRAHGRVE